MEAPRKLYTLTELSRVTGISYPTLQRYAELYQDRIPSAGEGRYPREAIAEIEQIHRENQTVEDDPAHAE